MKKSVSLSLVLLLLAALIASCGATPEPQTVIQTVEVEKTVIETVEVEKTVVETVEVEKEVEVATVVTATPEPEKELEPVHIVYWTDPALAKPARHPEFTEIGQYEEWQAQQFMDMYPHVTIEVQGLDWADLPKKTAAAVAAGSPPDIMKDYLGRTSGYSWADVLVPLDDLVPQDVWDDVNPGLLDLYRINGKIHAMPIYWWEHHLAVNKALFDKAGLTDMLPLDDYTWSFDEFYAAAKAIQDAGVGVEYPLGLQVASEQGDYDIHAFFWGAGAKTWLDDCSGLGYDDPNALEALTFLKKLYDEGLINPDATTVGWQDVNNLFYTGKAVFWGGGLAALMVTLPQAQAEGQVTVDMDAQLIMYPTLDGEPSNGLAAGPTGLMVFQKEGRSDYELEWIIKYLLFLSSPDWQRDYTLNNSQFPAFLSVGAPLAGNADYELALKLATERGVENMGLACPHFAEIRVAQPPHWQAVFLGQETPEEALNMLMEESADILSQ